MLRERRQLVELWKRGDAVALATLVHIEGSSYRRTGARLLIAGNGDYAGSVSGGCLEAEVIRKAQWLVRDGACMQRYSTLFENTADIPYGLGCGGVVELLLEPARTPEFEMLMHALEASLAGEAQFVDTWLPQNGQPFGRSVSRREGLAGARGVFHEVLFPPQRLLVFGAGDDAQPLVQMASLLGWRVMVADSRVQWARAERFPEAELVVSSASVDALHVSDKDAAVVMTHSYEQDSAWLAQLLPHRLRYLGLLGARHRSALLASEAAARLGWPLERVCERMFAPVGLDLGGDGAEAIALAVVAEVQACIEGKLGRSRRMTADGVEEQVAQGGASRYLQAQCAV